jgi:hypothetical protein
MNQQTTLLKAISITDEILQVLQDGDYQQVSQLDLQRQPLIEQIFKNSIEQIDLIKAHHLQSLNQQVVEKLGEFKQSVLLQQAQIRTASKATRAYQSNHSATL